MQPVNKSQILSTAVDSQPCADAYIVQWERLMFKDKKSLGNYYLLGFEPILKDFQQIENTFNIDAKCLLNITAKDKKTKKEENISNKNSVALSCKN